jgi:beta-mannanase
MLSWGPSGGNNGRAATDTEHIPLGAMLARFVAGPDNAVGTADDRRVYLRYAWEPNVSSHAWAPNCGLYQGSYLDYINAWRRAYNTIQPMVGGSTRVAWVFSVGNVNSPGCADGAALYPGDAYVQWVGMDVYAYQCGGITPATAIGPMLSSLRSKTSRPVGIDEVGVTHLGSGWSVTAKDNWIRDYWAYLRANDIRMSVWWNAKSAVKDTDCTTYNGNDWGVFGEDVGTGTFSFSGTSYNVYNGYRDGLQATSTVEANTSNPRYLTDAQFLGQ